MMKLFRQDGSAIELSDEDGAKWLKLGIGTMEAPPAPAAPVIDVVQPKSKMAPPAPVIAE